MPIDISVVEGLAPEEEKAIFDRLRSFNASTFGDSDRKELAIPLYDSEGGVAGGLVGFTGRGWLYVDVLFVPESSRGQGLASRLLALAEDEARARGCVGSYIDTMNPQALRAYIRHGYHKIGALKGLTGDHSITWLAKRF